MTEEKIEFEEILKVESRKESTKTEELAEISVDAEDVNTPDNVVHQTDTMSNGDSNKEGDNT